MVVVRITGSPSPPMTVCVVVEVVTEVVVSSWAEDDAGKAGKGSAASSCELVDLREEGMVTCTVWEAGYGSIASVVAHTFLMTEESS